MAAEASKAIAQGEDIAGLFVAAKNRELGGGRSCDYSCGINRNESRVLTELRQRDTLLEL